MAARPALERIADAATIAVALVAVALGGSILLRGRVGEAGSGQGPRREDVQVTDWERMVENGHRMGPVDAKVTILYFGDYECPFCRAADRTLRALLEQNSDELAVVFRHFPLASHPGAYRTARMAECGAQQGRFEAVHKLLLSSQEPAGLDLAGVALEAQIPDFGRFAECVEGEDEIHQIRQDRLAAESLGIRSTPRFILQGVLLGSSPDSAGLSDLVSRALEENRN